MTELYIKELDISSFGKFIDKKIILDKSFNLIYGDNESGKSTLADFIEGVLYGFDQGKKRRSFSYKKEKYKPKFSYKYGGKILFSYKARDILVERNFDSGAYKIIDLTKKEEIPGPPSDLNFPGKYLLGLSYESYQNLIKNYQSQVIDEDSKKLIMEIFMEGPSDLNFSYKKARENLERNLEELGSPRAFTKPYYLTKAKVDELDKENKYLKNLRKDYEIDLINLYDQREKLKSYRKDLDKLKKQRDSYRKNLAFANYKEEEKSKERLIDLERKLEAYQAYDGIEKSYFDRVDRLIDKEKFDSKDNIKRLPSYLYFIFGVLIVILAYFLKKPLILLALVLLLPLYIYDSRTKNLSQTSLDEELSIYGLKDIRAYREFKNYYYDYLSIKSKKDSLEEVLKVLERQEKATNQGESSVNLDIGKLESDIRRLEDAYEYLVQKNMVLEKKLSYTEEELSRLVRVEEDLKYYKDKFRRIEDEIKATRLSLDLLAKSKAKDQDLIKDLNSRINLIIRQITKASYKQISYDENLKPLIIREDGTSLELEQLSKGFFDQLNFALKLVLREKTSKNKYIIFDDALINFDENRLKDSLYFLLDLAANTQIIYLTCHKREAEIIDREDIYVNKIRLE